MIQPLVLPAIKVKNRILRLQRLLEGSDIDAVKQIFRDGYINTELALQDFRDAFATFEKYETVLFLLHANGKKPLEIIRSYPDEVIELLMKYDHDVATSQAEEQFIQGVQRDWFHLRQVGVHETS